MLSCVWMSIAARDLSLLDIAAHGGRFLFSISGSYNSHHRQTISCLPILQKLYFNSELSLSSSFPEPLLLPQPTKS